MLNFKPPLSEASWRGAAAGVFCALLIVFVVFIFGNLQGAGVLLFGSGALLAGVAIVAFFTLAAMGGFWLIGLMPWYYQAAWLAAVIICNYSLPAATLEGVAWIIVTVIVCPSILGGSLASLWVNTRKGIPLKRQQVPLCCASIAGLVLLFVIYWLAMPGSEDRTTKMYSNVEIAPLDMPNPASKGLYEVAVYYYGSGKDYYRGHFGPDADIKTEPVDGSPFITGWEGWTGWLRTYFWGFDAKQLPLNGRVWFPKGGGSFPLVLLVHGNHTMSDFSDGGYDYLGGLLASQGFIVVSVDQNFLNTSFFDAWSAFDEIPARGWLLLKHLALWRQWNKESGNPFFRRVDMDKIGLIGHSRGGEAILSAEALNRLPLDPDNAMISMDFNFSIKALAAIAPKDGQYMPAGNMIPLKNVNYFSMHGSHDSDVRSFEGMKAYQRLVFDDGSYWFKAALYIVGANHGQFNEAWGRFDATLPESLFLNLRPLLSGVQQRQIAEVYLSAFLKATLKDDKRYIPLFWDARLGKAWLPDALLLNQFEDSKAAFVYAGKQDLDITVGTLPGTIITQDDLTLWRQEKVLLKQGDRLDNAIFAGWTDKKGRLTVVLPTPNPLPVTIDSVLTFSLADANEAPREGRDVHRSEVDLIDLTVELTDAHGEKASLPLSHVSYLFPQVVSQDYKSLAFDLADGEEIIFQSFRMPMSDFVKINPSFEIQQLHTISFLFDRTQEGVVIFDRIGFD